MSALKRLRKLLKNRYRTRQRRSKFESDLWAKEGSLAQRRYDSYDAYLDHQGAKLASISDKLRQAEPEDLAEFKRRFESCEQLPGRHTVLCLGARLGTEVRALRDLGYLAVGIDLNPGDKNPYVFYGDFHQLAFADASFDAVYTNALDHAFDLTKLIAEVHRVLQHDGILITDVVPGYEEGFLPGKFEATHWRRIEELQEQICEAGLYFDSRRNLGQVRRETWYQLVFRRSRAPDVSAEWAQR